jgi:hypothetical protein
MSEGIVENDTGGLFGKLPDSPSIVDLNAYGAYEASLLFFDVRGRLGLRLRELSGIEHEVTIEESEVNVGGMPWISVEPHQLLVLTPNEQGLEEERALVVSAVSIVAEELGLEAFDLAGVGANIVIPARTEADLVARLDQRFGLADPGMLRDAFGGPLEAQSHAYRVSGGKFIYSFEIEALSQADVVGHSTLLWRDDYPERFMHVNLKVVGASDLVDNGEVFGSMYDETLNAAERLVRSLESVVRDDN